MTKVVLDGALFSECELSGNNRHGMLRVAEEITKLLVEKGEMDISFANTVYLPKYHKSLVRYIQKKFPELSNKILSQKPLPVFNLLKYKAYFRKYPGLMFMPVKNKGIGSADIFHSFYYPFSKKVEQSTIKKCLTFLDIISLRMNGYPQEMQQLTHKIVKHIQHNYAISISEFSKNDLLNYNPNINPERVFVSPLSASKELFYQNRNKEDWEFVREKYKLPERYFLCISSSDLRKNIPHLINSFSKFILQEKPMDIFLVLAGNSTHSRKLLNQLNIDKAVRDKIVFANKFIDEDDLAVVYSNAIAFFFMSYYEGFGLPVLEAMQCGTPVVAANCTSIPEVVGDAGLLLPPDDVDELCGIMHELNINEGFRDSLSAKGLAKTATFSWERTAREYTDIFNTISNF